jgi:hypothetical protein
MKPLFLVFALLLAVCAPLRAQLNTYNAHQTLASPIDSADWIPLWDTSAGGTRKISPTNLLASRQPIDTDLTAIAALTDPNEDRILFWDDSTSSWTWLGLGTNLSISGSTINAGLSGIWVYRDTWTTATAYTASDVVTAGSGLYICVSNHTSDALTQPGVGGNWATVWKLMLGPAIGGYNATTWNGNNEIPTKDAIRDKIESGGIPTTLPENTVGFGDSNNLLNGTGTFTFNPGTGIFSVPFIVATTLTANTVTANTSTTTPALTVTGITTQTGGAVSTAFAMPALAIDFSKALNVKTLAANAAMTYTNATLARQWTELEVSNTAASPITVTLSTTTYDGGSGPVVPNIVVPAAVGGVNGLRRVALEWTGSRYQLHQGGSSGAGGSGFPLTANGDLAGFNLSNGGTISAATISASGAISGLTLSGDLDSASLPDLMPARTYEKITTAAAIESTPTPVAATTGAVTTIDASKAYSVVTLNETAETLAFSNVPPEGTPILVRFIPHTADCDVTTPSFYSLNIRDNRLGFKVRLNSPTLWQLWRSNGAWFGYEPTEMADLPAHATPTGSYLMETYNPANGASGKSSITEIITGNSIKTTRTGVRRTVYFNAGAMIPRTTAGAAAATVETGTNDIMFDTKDFDQTTVEGVGFWWATPPTWNGGSLTAKFHWTASAGTVAETVVWSISCRDYTDSDELDQAPGTAQSVSDALLATGDLHITSTTAAMTPAGDNLSGKPIYFQVTRATATDNLAADARLLGVVIEYTESATEPAAQ